MKFKALTYHWRNTRIASLATLLATKLQITRAIKTAMLQFSVNNHLEIKNDKIRVVKPGLKDTPVKKIMKQHPLDTNGHAFEKKKSM